MSKRRTRARETALQMLYQYDLNPELQHEVVREQVLERLEDETLSRFAWSLYIGVIDSRAELDGAIERIAANWSLRRMAMTDRNVLRIGAFELLKTDTPPRVVIDEAIEMARKFGSAQSSQFVNGILDRLIPGVRQKPTVLRPPSLGEKSAAVSTSVSPSTTSAVETMRIEREQPDAVPPDVVPASVAPETFTNTDSDSESSREVQAIQDVSHASPQPNENIVKPPIAESETASDTSATTLTDSRSLHDLLATTVFDINSSVPVDYPEDL